MNIISTPLSTEKRESNNIGKQCKINSIVFKNTNLKLLDPEVATKTKTKQTAREQTAREQRTNSLLSLV